MKRFYLLVLALICIVLTACSTQTAEPQIIEDVIQYSRISAEELTSIMGEPADTEEWTNKTSKGDFKVTTFFYDKNNNHYEFIVADNSVVRLTIYSSKYWTGEGENFKYSGNKQNMCKPFNIELSDNAKLTADTNYAYRISPVNDKVADFWVQDIDTSSKTFGMAKITYNLNYFD